VTEGEARAVLARALEEVAPEVAVEALDPALPLLEQVDLDSMDFLAFVEGVADETGVDLPERDYDRLATLASGAAYLAALTGPEG
jgi:acyl carrier protein